MDLLRIVHVACRLADVLGYDVVKPLLPAQASDVIAQLPAQARARMSQNPAELRQRIEERLQEFGAEAADAPPEETLALLASACATGNPELAANVEANGEWGTQEPVERPSPPARNHATVLWIAAGLAVVALAALWAFR